MLPPSLTLYLTLPAWFLLLAAVVLFGFCLYVCWHERWLRRHLNDIAPNRQLNFLQSQYGRLRWQLVVVCLLVLFATAASLSPLKPAETITLPVEQPQAEAIAAEEEAPVSMASPSDILELYDNPAPSEADTSLDALKEHHENALIGAYILHRCQRAKTQEVQILLRALQNDILRYQERVPGTDSQALYASIVSAAEGSYQMMYIHTPCERPEVDILEQQFANFIMRHPHLQPANP